LIETVVAAVVLHDTLEVSGIFPLSGLTVIELHAGVDTGTIRITAGSVLFEVMTSFGFESSAVLVRYVVEDETLTGTLIVGNEAPIARVCVRVQTNEVDPFAPEHVHPAPVGVAVSVTPAGSGSLTVVVEFTSPPEPTFLISIVYVKVLLLLTL
jgi:hypothetical protein